MFQRIARLLVLVAAVQLLGGQWLVLQSVAWAGMLVSFAQTETVVVAIEKTFDGEHPCDLCQAVQKGQNEDRQQAIAKMLVKIDAVLAVAAALPVRQAEPLEFLDLESAGAVRMDAPPVPPPLA